jgi:peptidoglycan/xylan/chitin deacetylase (PgdA/CDA1 family)
MNKKQSRIMLNFKLLIFLFILSSNLLAQQKMVAITIDDLPFVRIGSFTDRVLNTKTVMLLDTLKKYQAPATGFVNLSKVFNDDRLDSTRFDLLRLWLNKGFDLGNHTFSHPDYNAVSYTDYIADIEKNENLLNKILKEHKKTMVYFRHPYLHRGNTRAKADSLADYLRNRHYIEAPVTIDNAEWIFAAAYDSVIKTKDNKAISTVGEQYIRYMEAKLKYYEGQSQKLFGQNIRQILLIHANSLNCDYIGKLLQMFVSKGYTFVNLKTALEDELYKTEDQFYRNGGISWLDRWAITQKKSKDFYKDEPVCPAAIMNLAKVDSE